MSYLDIAKRVEARLRASDSQKENVATRSTDSTPLSREPHIGAAVTASAEKAEEVPPDSSIEILSMPLAIFESYGQVIEISVAWWHETLFFVPIIKDAEALHLEGIAPHRIWTARELSLMLDISSVTPSDLQMVMVTRREFGGEIVELRPRE